MVNHNNTSKSPDDDIIWGVDINKAYGPKDVRDAIVSCFINSNGDMVLRMSGETVPQGEEEKRIRTKALVEDLIRRAFEKSDGDFDNPTKDSIMKVLEHLKNVANKVNQSDAVIARNYSEITRLVDGLK